MGLSILSNEIYHRDVPFQAKIIIELRALHLWMFVILGSKKLILRGFFLLFLLFTLALTPMFVFTVLTLKKLRIKSKVYKSDRDLFSGDRPLSKKDKLTYFVYNFISGISGYSCNIKSNYWYTDEFARRAREEGRGFPTRIFLNQFLVQEVPKMVEIENIDVLDVGCGSGYIREFLSDVGYTGSYTGIDIYKDIDFDDYTPYFESNLIESRIEDFETDKEFDLILSITSLEHIENDVLSLRSGIYL